MHKVLIADVSCDFCEDVAKHLGPQYFVEGCQGGRNVVELMNEMAPDILIVDLSFSNVDGIALIRLLRSAGNNIPIFVLTECLDDSIISTLLEMRVFYMFRQACTVDALVCSIRALSNNKSLSLWVPETEVDNILMMLSFRIGSLGYENVRTAILLQFYGEEDGLIKCLYPAVAKRNGGNAVQVEKSIRDAIRYAFRRGDRSLWTLYFPLARENHCPSNKVFIARIVYALQALERLPGVSGFRMYKD